MFQFTVNVTIMFTLIVKEVITNKTLLWMLLANTFTVNYLAIYSFQATQESPPPEGGNSILGVSIRWLIYVIKGTLWL
jgi:hypothetical protein